MYPAPDCPLQAAYMLGDQLWELKLDMEFQLFGQAPNAFVGPKRKADLLLPIASSLWTSGKPKDASSVSPTHETLKSILPGLLQEYKALLDNPERKQLAEQLQAYHGSCADNLTPEDFEEFSAGNGGSSDIIAAIRNYLFSSPSTDTPESAGTDQRAGSSGIESRAEARGHEQRANQRHPRIAPYEERWNALFAAVDGLLTQLEAALQPTLRLCYEAGTSLSFVQHVRGLGDLWERASYEEERVQRIQRLHQALQCLAAAIPALGGLNVDFAYQAIEEEPGFDDVFEKAKRKAFRLHVEISKLLSQPIDDLMRLPVRATPDQQRPAALDIATRSSRSAEPPGCVQPLGGIVPTMPSCQSASEEILTTVFQQQEQKTFTLAQGGQPISNTEFERLLRIKKEIDPNNKYIGESAAILRVFEKIKEFNALPNAPILILGPTGAGKTAIAKLIHVSSARKKKPFRPEQAAGHKASDTGILIGQWAGYGKGHGIDGIAKEGQDGILHQCDGGTIFIDEVGDLGPQFQLFLLDVLDNKEIQPEAGHRAPLEANVRLIFATNKDMNDLIDNKEFRRDLYYRFKELTIRIPPLADHIEDIFFFVREKCGGCRYDDGFLLCLLRQPWPGNVRELLKVLEFAKTKAESAKVPLSVDLLGSIDSMNRSVLAEVRRLSKQEQTTEVMRLLMDVLQKQGLEYRKGLAKRMASVRGVSKYVIHRKLRSLGLC